MKYTPEEVMQYVREEDVKFVRMAFCDVYGRHKNVAIQASELPRAFTRGIAMDGSAVDGFGGESAAGDLLLHPDPSTLVQLPWRPQHGRVAHMFCDITHPDGAPFAADTRRILREAVETAEKLGYAFDFGSEMEFYLLKLDEYGEPSQIPHDRAGYMDVAPEDKGENIRREICLTLERMGIQPERSLHKIGPGQNEIDFHHSDSLTAADHAVLFYTMVRTVAAQNGLWADFSPKPFPDQEGSGMHINLSVRNHGTDPLPQIIAGLLELAPDMTAFLNPSENSYARLGGHRASSLIGWSRNSRAFLLRVPNTDGRRSPNPDGRIVSNPDGRRSPNTDGQCVPNPDGRRVSNADGRHTAGGGYRLGGYGAADCYPVGGDLLSTGRRVELRSPDAFCNPYLAYALVIHAGLYGIQKNLPLPQEADLSRGANPSQGADLPQDANLSQGAEFSQETGSAGRTQYRKLPATLQEAVSAASDSAFIREHLPPSVIAAYCQGGGVRG